MGFFFQISVEKSLSNPIGVGGGSGNGGLPNRGKTVFIELFSNKGQLSLWHTKKFSMESENLTTSTTKSKLIVPALQELNLHHTEKYYLLSLHSDSHSVQRAIGVTWHLPGTPSYTVQHTHIYEYTLHHYTKKCYPNSI